MNQLIPFLIKIMHNISKESNFTCFYDGVTMTLPNQQSILHTIIIMHSDLFPNFEVGHQFLQVVGFAPIHHQPVLQKV